MEIFFAKEKHLEFIRQIALNTWPDAFGAILSKEQINYMLELMYSVNSLKKQIHSGHQFILAKNEKEYFGYASYEFNYKSKPETKIHKLYVLPKKQGKGVGNLLMSFIEKEALKSQNSSLILNVNRFNKAVQYYHKIGFKTIKEENIDIGNGFLMEDYVMEKHI